METKLTSARAMELERDFGAQNYLPLPVVLSEGKGVHVWDLDGKQYYDFLSAYSAVNQGHCHPRIIKALTDQAQKLTLTSRAFYSDKLGVCEQYMSELFGYDKVLFMNTGAEANETAIKLIRKWGYVKKGIAKNEAVIVVAKSNFHGRTTAIISASTSPKAKEYFGPFLPGFDIVEYNNLEELEKALSNPNVAGFLVEPIQGEAGVNVPDEGYLKKASELCKKHNVLLVADEVQTGVGRTGKVLASQHDEVVPDMIVLGKAISGGAYPVSAVMANDDIMLLLKPGEHGSTYGGNPLAAAVVMEALQVVVDEKLPERAAHLGEIFRNRMAALVEKTDLLNGVRGKGLLNALLVNDEPTSSTGLDICHKLMESGLLAKPTHGNVIRFAPPLVITEEQLNECCDIIEKVILNFEK